MFLQRDSNNLDMHSGKSAAKKTWSVAITVVSVLVLLFLLFFYILGFGPKFFVASFPYLDLAAKLSGYSGDVTTVSEVERVVTLEQGGFLVMRDLKQYRMAAGIRAFPDGGTPFYIFWKKDISRVSDGGEIMWRKTYTEYPVDKYNNGVFVNESEFKKSITYPAVMDGIVSAIRSCSSNKVQLARFEENWKDLGGRASGLVGYGDFIGSGVEIDLGDGSIKEFSDKEELCQKDIQGFYRQEGNYFCDAGTYDFITKVTNINKISVLRQYYQFPCNFVFKGGKYPKVGLQRETTLSPRPGDNLDIPI